MGSSEWNFSLHTRNQIIVLREYGTCELIPSRRYRGRKIKFFNDREIAILKRALLVDCPNILAYIVSFFHDCYETIFQFDIDIGPFFNRLSKCATCVDGVRFATAWSQIITRKEPGGLTNGTGGFGITSRLWICRISSVGLEQYCG